MYDSSESDIIQRSKHSKRRKGLIEDESYESTDFYSSENMPQQDLDPIFLEVFGTGKEYSYIYEQDEMKENQEKDSGEVYMNIDDCLSYIKNILPKSISTQIDKSIVQNLNDGYCPEFLAFHCDKSSVRDLYYVKEILEEYVEFSKIPKSKYYDTLRSYKFFTGIESSINIPGLLTIEEYCENIYSFQRIHEPKGILNCSGLNNALTDEWGEQSSQNSTFIDTNQVKSRFNKAINQISKNPIFKDRVNRLYEHKIVDLDGDHPFSLENLVRLYSTDTYDMSNSIRRIIISEAMALVDINKNKLTEKLAMCGFGSPGLKESADLIVSLEGAPGSYSGLFLDKKNCLAVLLDESGNITEKALFKENDYDLIKQFVSSTENVCVTSNTPNVKYFISNMKTNLYYVPQSLAFYKEHKDFSIPYCIAAVVQNPILYFSKLFYSAKNKIKSYMIFDSSKIHLLPPITPFDVFSNISRLECLKKAIRIASATKKIDWKTTLKHPHGYMLLDLFEIQFSDKYFDYESIGTLENLKSIFDSKDFSNICTFFKLKESKNLLDTTDIHPNNYFLATILCKGLFFKLKSSESTDEFNKKKDNEIISVALQNRSLFGEITLPAEEDFRKDFISPTSIQKMLLPPKEMFFIGANDRQIFDDIMKPLKDKILTGVITKVGRDFYLANVQGVTVYIKKSADLVLNQMVEILIKEENVQMLSFSGEVIAKKPECLERFKTHALFRNFDQKTIQLLLERENKNVLIRPSSAEGYCNAVCRLNERVFASFKVKETFEGKYDFSNTLYDSLDDFIQKYIKSMYQTLYKIKSLKYFFNTYDEALEYLKTPSEFLKYALIISNSNPGYLEFLFGNKKVPLKIDGSKLLFKNTEFSEIQEFIDFLKKNYNNL